MRSEGMSVPVLTGATLRATDLPRANLGPESRYRYGRVKTRVRKSLRSSQTRAPGTCQPV